ncbi:hypothetical protein OV208_17830 [Corallococcus sp. bb12-1]|uniref:hypothetical protein n=1 Tax=Corallococcus sp. bb12-1 TaxID=2996784 RepID=UPI0022720EE9|nr:hypothetical protein [Corallococcus sp. bb12-1]MCY1043182.1 hypothetical protein [Corallococcus sp. bb12-1]
MVIEGSSFLLTVLWKYYGPEEPNPVRRAVLDSTYFLHPDVVAQTKGLPIVRARRLTSPERKNTVAADGDFVSDNFPPDYVFRAAMTDTRDQGSTQLSHIYGGNGEARDAFLYTNLANLCLMPSFLAKFADTDASTVTLLKQCAYVLYGFNPRREVNVQSVNPELRGRLKLATPLKKPLHSALAGLRDAKFLRAKAAGYLFTPEGAVNDTDPWVAEMVIRRQATVEATPLTDNHR